MSVPVQHVTGTPGRTVALKCEVDAYPRADIQWVKRGEYEEIETSGRYEKIETSDRYKEIETSGRFEES